MPVTEGAGFGAAITPEEWSQFVLDNLGAASVILASGATEIRTTAQSVHAPRFTGNGTVGCGAAS